MPWVLEYPQTSSAIVMIATTAGCRRGRHMDEVNEDSPDERRMIIKGAWQSIATVVPKNTRLRHPPPVC
ncbi:hypothetical protein Y032_0913g3022 [Ancylostoma ceylanicum]|uniref:Uncharacterized protein n=1 Tax=Ancylostoma ceylanicum TaxID=53326 RepID=A0A016W8U4_9BILA|nr:hypothetical protein Y032_0913g3022 [Ancylostoma ceylanicum]